MLKKIPYFTMLLFILAACCCLTFQITFTETNEKWQGNVNGMINTSANQISEPLFGLMDVVKDNSVYAGDDESMAFGVMKGYVDALGDRFAMFMDEQNYKDYLAIVNSQNNLGIGVSTLYDESVDGIYIVNVYRTSPAELSGIVPGDIITHVNSVPVRQMGYYSVMHTLGTGAEGESVSVTVTKHDGSSKVYDLAVAAVKSQNITGQKLQDKIGLVTINRFASGDYENFKTVLAELINSGCEKFVIDVRNNPGGDFSTIEEMLNFILGDGPMFTVTNKQGAANTVISDAGKMAYPIAVLANENTVCGAEIFAACIKKGENCTLVGNATYGKSTTQSVFSNVSSIGGAVCLSTNKYTLSDGEDFDGVGVTPDVEIQLTKQDKMTFTTLSKEDDDQLSAAVELLKNQDFTNIPD